MSVTVVVEGETRTVVVSEDEGADVVVEAPVLTSAVTVEPESSVVVEVVEGMPGPPGPPGPGGERIELVRVAHAVLSGHRCVVERADGTFERADNTNPAHLHRQPGVTTGAALAGDDVTAVMVGPLDEPTWSWTPGLPLYLGAAGQLTQSPPAAPDAVFLCEVGRALTPTSVFVQPQAPIVLST